jgi:outer membrane biosynthesis protein TonB
MEDVVRSVALFAVLALSVSVAAGAQPTASTQAGDRLRFPVRVQAPVFPAVASKIGIEALIRVTVEVLSDGTVTSAEANHQVPWLTEASLDAARQWKFPVAESAQDVRRLVLEFMFQVDDRNSGDQTPVHGAVFYPPYRVEVYGLRFRDSSIAD